MEWKNDLMSENIINLLSMKHQEHHHTIKRPGCLINYWVSGNPDKPLIFMAHGAGADHRQFELQITHLINDYQIIRWDMRGHSSSRPLKGTFNVYDAVNDMLLIMDCLGHDKAILMGQSLGSYVIQELAFYNPHRVKAIIIIDGTCITSKLSPLENLSLKISPFIFWLWPYENLKKAMVEASSVKKDTKTYLKECFDQLSKSEFINIWKGTSMCMHHESNYHVKCPLLLVYGEHDETGNIRKSMNKWSEWDKQSEYRVISDAGHTANQDNPELFIQALLEFLKKL